jgi:peptidoglycan DL-endopeptidase CwlO
VSAGVGAYLAQVDRVLAVGQGLFPTAGSGPRGVSVTRPNVPIAPSDARLSLGVRSVGDGYQGGWATVSGLDAQTSGAAGQGDAEGQAGRSGAVGVRQSAASAAAAIAPATGSAAGVKVLVSSMDDRLAAMQQQIDTTRAQNRMLGLRLRQIVMAYRSSAATAPAGMSRGMPFGGSGAGIPSLGGLGGGGVPGLSALSGLPSALTGLSTGRGDASRDGGGAAVAGDAGSSGRAQRAVAFARSKLGAPYVWGATGPNAFDCSGLVQWAYGKASVALPRTTYELLSSGVPVNRNDIRAGDLILCNWSAPRTPEHVVMAVSPTTCIEAPNKNSVVRLSSIPPGRIEVRRVVV